MARRQDDRRRGRLERGGAGGTERHQPPRRLQVGAQERQGLGIALLERAQPGNGGGIAGAYAQVKAAQALDGQDLPPRQPRGGVADWVAAQRGAAAVHQLQPRPAGVARCRLGMKPAIAGIVKLVAARGAERKAGHGGVGPVVGHAAYDRVARPAARAVGQSIAAAAVARVQQLAATVGAGSQIDRDLRPAGARAGAAAGDAEAALAKPARQEREVGFVPFWFISRHLHFKAPQKQIADHYGGDACGQLRFTDDSHLPHRRLFGALVHT